MKKSSSFPLKIFDQLIKAAEAITSKVHAHLDQYNLTLSQFGVLETIFQQGPLCQKEIAARILKSSGNLTMVINNLEKRDLVERTKNEQDKRYSTVAMTPSGQRVFKSVYPKHAAIIAEAMSVLGDEEQQQLETICRKIQILRDPQMVDARKTPIYAVTKPTKIL